MSSRSSDTNSYMVLGLQRSGTTYTQRIIEKNTSLELDDSAWKHTLPPIQTDAHKILVTKHPYNWTSSIVTRNRVDVLWKWRKYRLLQKGPSMWRDINLQHLMELWNDWNAAWIEQDVHHVKYEDLLSQPFNTLKTFGREAGVEVMLPPAMNVSTSKFHITDDRKRDYVGHVINAPIAEQLNKYIDRTLMVRLGYTMVK